MADGYCAKPLHRYLHQSIPALANHPALNRMDRHYWQTTLSATGNKGVFKRREKRTSGQCQLRLQHAEKRRRMLTGRRIIF